MKAALKICGMKYAENINNVAATEPDYLGFIFYAKSSRYFDGQIPNLPATIKKVGVFVDADLKYIQEKLQKYKLDVIQLHGDESPDFCKQVKVLKSLRTDNISKYETEAASTSEVQTPVSSEVEVPVLSEVEVWKVFSIRDHFDFDKLKPYEDHVDAFLFDTKGKEKGGNGHTFDWNVLNHYPSKKPIVLSGGIGIQEVNQLEQILKTDLPIKIIDVNSKFEEKPGFKNVQKLKEFFTKIETKKVKNGTQVAIFNKNDIKTSISSIFSRIEKAKTYKKLKELEDILSKELGKKYFIAEDKYPKLHFTFTANEIKDLIELNHNDGFKKLAKSKKLSALEKLMFSILWKNGDLGKEQHVIEGLVCKKELDKREKGLVFYQFGKKLAKPNKEPIIDQHILRAFKFYKNTTQHLYKNSNTISKKDSLAIEDYKKWIQSIIELVAEKEDHLYYIDRILFGIGKYLKVNGLF